MRRGRIQLEPNLQPASLVMDPPSWQLELYVVAFDGWYAVGCRQERRSKGLSLTITFMFFLKGLYIVSASSLHGMRKVSDKYLFYLHIYMDQRT